MSTLIADNRRAKFDYTILETYECGLVLVGTEVKALREKRVHFGDAYALLKNHELFLLGLRIDAYLQGNQFNHELDRTRKLLLHRREIDKLYKQTTRKGLTLIPLKIYFNDAGKAKVLIGLAEGKSKIDKRSVIKKREGDREIARVMRRGQR